MLFRSGVAGGTPVVISGEGLSGVSEVWFGPVGDALSGVVEQADFVSQSDSAISLLTPAGQGAGLVQVSVVAGDDGGAGGSAGAAGAAGAVGVDGGGVLVPGGFTYVSPVSGIRPGTGSIAGGTPVVISGEGLSGVSQVWFGPVGEIGRAHV